MPEDLNQNPWWKPLTDAYNKVLKQLGGIVPRSYVGQIALECLQDLPQGSLTQAVEELAQRTVSRLRAFLPELDEELSSLQLKGLLLSELEQEVRREGFGGRP